MTRACGGSRHGEVDMSVFSFNPGDGCLHRSVAAGPSLREVGASAAQPSPALFPGGEGFHSLAPPALGFLS
ncbi:hypothetical protein HID58_000875 [Brassica napus]|uniref:Uncharacterized protein n=1 Tax=Brassica napus TaxID=3708 RepID=A0ABQ8EIF1_BRANA|nr:hypothetical protein HID58_000875 [Brassica napus]